MSRVALAASITHGLISLGHTIKGGDTFSLPLFRSLPTLLLCYAKAGWYQGSGFFALLALYTYQLSQRPAATWTTIDRAILGGLVAIYWVSGAWYVRNGDRPTGVITGIAGLITAAAAAQ